ncbi:TPA: hypothetical protein ACGOUY_000079 [Streptococcus suis]
MPPISSKEVLEVSQQALSVPDIESEQGLMHTLFALEDLYGLKVELVDGEAVLHIESKGTEHPDTAELISAWAEQSAKYKAGEITKDEYDRWRYNYPKYDTTGKWHKVPSKELSDAMVDAFKDKLKDM